MSAYGPNSVCFDLLWTYKSKVNSNSTTSCTAQVRIKSKTYNKFTASQRVKILCSLLYDLSSDKSTANRTSGSWALRLSLVRPSVCPSVRPSSTDSTFPTAGVNYAPIFSWVKMVVKVRVARCIVCGRPHYVDTGPTSSRVLIYCGLVVRQVVQLAVRRVVQQIEVSGVCV